MNSSSELSKEKIESNKIESKDTLKKLKYKYILQILFNNLFKKKSLEIIKYNKNIKERINISIKDYKEYSEMYSSIEIEIKPVNNKFGNFINMNENDKKYYHIYFNDNKEEIKRNYLKKNENVTKLKIIIDFQVKSFYELFDNCKCIEYIYFNKFYRNNINNMAYMFYGCSSLISLPDISKWNTKNVTDMGYMFYECSSLKSLPDISKWKTNNVVNISNMFRGCTSLLKMPDISKWDTSNVIDMSYLFFE